MAYNDLILSMEEGAEEKIAGIRLEIQAKVDEIDRESLEKADLLHRSLVEEAHSTAKDQRNRIMYQVRGEENVALSKEKERMVNEAFQKAGNRLSGLRNDPAYRDLFAMLLSESLEAIDSNDIRVHVDTRDLDLCKSCLDEKKLQVNIIPDLTTAGGVEISSADGKIRVYNTLESRLEKARNVFNKEVCRLLFGE
jgi:V/A-type H+-transporting ATPase subunit E